MWREERAMRIKRDSYLDKLIAHMWDGQIKIITGIRRCGKSYLLGTIFKEYLLSQGVKSNHILSYELDKVKDIRFRDPLVLASHVRETAEGSADKFYLFIDEVQLSDTVPNPYNPDGKNITFYDALNDLMAIPNLDVYVTGSNSKMLASDVLTEFRGRADDIRLHPLTFHEFYSAVGGDAYAAFDDYAFYGGMPLILSQHDDESKMNYLNSLFTEVYIRDIMERRGIKREDVLSNIIDLLCSSVGSLTNPSNVTNTLNSKQKRSSADLVANNTVKSYMGYLEDAFLFREVKRWNVKGKAYFDYPNKYYCEDIGLRNARIGFRQQEMTHMMENILYNDLIARGCAVDVGVVSSNETNKKGNSIRVAREIDFVANRGSMKTYIQSAYALDDDAKAETENKPFLLTGDSFPKIVVRHDIRKRWNDDNGILNIGLIDFLLDDGIV